MDLLPLLTMQDFLQLPDDRMGPALFDTTTSRLSPGAECFKDYILSDFPADMMKEGVETSAPLARVLNITRDLVQDLRGSLEEREKFLKTYELSKMSAVEAANKVIQMAEKVGGEKGQRKKEHATTWCANELKKIEMKGAELVDHVARTSTSVGKKINSLLVHMKVHDLLSRTFLEALEAWQDLDAAAATSDALQKPPVEADKSAVLGDPYADTLVFRDGTEILNDAVPGEVREASFPLGNQGTDEQAAVDPIGNQGTDDQASAVEASSVPLGNQGAEASAVEGTDVQEAAAFEAPSVPLAHEGTEAAAVESLSIPIGNQGTDAEASAVEASSVPLGNQGTDERAAAVEASSVPLGNQGTDERAAAVEASSVPIGNQGTEAAAVEASSVPIGNQGTEAAAVEASSVPIGNQGTEAAAVEASSVPIGTNQGTDEQVAQSAEVHNTQLDPEPASPGTPKKHGNTGASVLCRIATPQKDRGLLAAACIECKEDIVAVDSDAEDDRLMDAMLQTQLEADIMRWFMWHRYMCVHVYIHTYIHTYIHIYVYKHDLLVPMGG